MATQQMSGISMGTGGGGASFDVDFSPSPFIMASQFDVMGVKVKSFKEPLAKSIREVMAPSLTQNFDVGGRPAWNDLMPATVSRRARLGYGATPILVRSGKLKRVAGQLNLWTIDGPGGTAQITNLPDGVFYGAIHQAGAETEWGGITARPWAVIQEEDMVEIEDIFLNWIDERINNDITAGRRGGYDG